MLPESSDRRDALPRGCVLRDYTIQEVLGHGGFGIVYKARHNELDRVVAIKEYLPSELAVREGAVIRPKSAECETYFADGLRRFRQEAKALLDFQQHPNIVDCREFFRTNGTAYLVMEYVDGLPLSELLRQRETSGEPFAQPDLLAIAVPLAKGLAHVHRAGVIHRDIKPANILVRRSDQQPVLIDFGAAKQAVAEHSRSLAPYTEGYAALEQVADSRLGPWTDMYGFGAVLWRMVAGGNRPWEPPNPVKVESRANARLRDGSDPLPSAKELGAGRFSEQILDIIDGCLQLQDTERISECDYVVQVLDAPNSEKQRSATGESQAEAGTEADRLASKNAEAQPIAATRKRRRNAVGLMAVAATVLALVAATLISSNEAADEPQTWSFRIEPEPATATVDLLNGPELYRPGVHLVPGRYAIEISAPGFASRREWISHGESDTVQRFALKPLPAPVPEPMPEPAQTPEVASEEVAEAWSFRIEPEPAAATVALLNSPELYRPGMHLVPGRYAVEVSAPGFASRREWIYHGESDTVQRLALNPLPAPVPEPMPEPVQTPEVASEEVAEAWSFRIEPEPATATVALLDSPELYRPGMHLAPGRYAVEVSAPGFATRREWIYHGGSDTVRSVALDPLTVPVPAQTSAVGPDEVARAAVEEPELISSNVLDGSEAVAADPDRARDQEHAAFNHEPDSVCGGVGQADCFELGESYRKGDGVPRDSARAAEFYRYACEDGHVEACSHLGVFHSKGEGAPLDRSRAVELFRRACEGGEMTACRNLGHSYFYGEAVTLNYYRAAEFYKRACEGGDATACRNLGHSHEHGKGVSVNHSRAAELYHRACLGDDMRSCANLGYSYEHGDGVRQDRARAAELYEQACKGGDMIGCRNLGVSYNIGSGVPQDRPRAIQLFHRACIGGNMRACVNLGYSYEHGEGVRRNRARAAKLYRMACNGDFIEGCHNLGNSYYYGEGVRLDRGQAAELYQRACDSGYFGACHNLGNLYRAGKGVRKNWTTAASLYDMACKHGIDDACDAVSSWDGAPFVVKGVVPDFVGSRSPGRHEIGP